MMVSILKEACVDLHFARERALEFWGLRVPCGDLLRTHGEFAILWNHAELFLPSIGLLAQFVPALIELPFVLIRPFLGDMMRCVRRAGCKIHKEGFVAREQALLANPGNRAIRHVLHEVVAFFRRLGRTDDFGALVNRRIPLVSLARDKTIEVFEPRARRPTIKRPYRTRLPHRDFMT